MLTINVFAFVAVSLGLIVAWLIGKGRPADAGVGHTIGSVIAGILLGVSLSFVAGVTHALCSELLTVCIRTTDTTIWSVAYPAIAIPGYWLAMFVGAASSHSRESTG